MRSLLLFVEAASCRFPSTRQAATQPNAAGCRVYIRLALLLVCLEMLALLPAVAFAHGSNVFDSGHETGTHTHAAAHADHATGDAIAEFDELHEQIEQLEARLIAHDERVRMTDIVGGIGYIVGIAGVAYYCLGSRRSKQRKIGRPV